MSAVPPRPVQARHASSLTINFPSRSSRLADCPTLFVLPLPADTSLASLVCTYGFYGLPPNVWIPCNADIRSVELRTACSPGRHGGTRLHELGTVKYGCFIRALRYDEDHADDAVWAAITQEAVRGVHNEHPEFGPQEEADSVAQQQSRYYRDQQLVVRALQPPLRALEAAHMSAAASLTVRFTFPQLERMAQQVRRMFNLDGQQPYDEFYALMPLAREHGFARLFRSPSLFEDCVKTITLCNSSWTRITSMNHALSTELGVGSRYQLRIVVHAPPLQRILHSLTASNGVKESAQSRRMRGGTVTELKDGQHVTALRHELTVGVFPSPTEVAASTTDALRTRSQQSHDADVQLTRPDDQSHSTLRVSCAV